MKQRSLLLFLLAVSFIHLPGLLVAESAYEKDFKQLRANRDKAVATAVAPINARYKDELEKLFKKATQAADLDTAKEIQGELQLIGGADAAKSLGAKSEAPPSPNPLGEKADLKKLFAKSEWIRWANSTGNGKPTGNIVFHIDGKCTTTGWFATGNDAPLFYLVEGSNVVKLFHTDPKKNKNAPYWFLHVNVEEKTAKNDPSISTISGEQFMKYEGPAKGK